MVDDQDTEGIIVERDVDVPMRDGVVLRADVYRPESPGRHPGLLVRTPYGKPLESHGRFARAGFVVVSQDTRGRYASDGEWVPFSVPNTGDAEDGYDSVEWLAEQPYCDGNVGTMGGSYCGWMQWELAKLRPPHLRAMCAFSIPLELADVDWSGGFKPARRVFWWIGTMAPDLRRRHGMSPPHIPKDARRIWNNLDGERWLWFLPWTNLPHYLPPGLAEYAEDWIRDPGRRPWGFGDVHTEVEVPNLDFSGWYDHCGGTMAHLGLMQREARTETARTQSKLVLGAWNHGGFGKRKIGGIDFGPEAAMDVEALKIRWFDHWLKGVDNGIDREPAVRYFVMGAKEWRTAETWPPPPNPATTALYLDSDDYGSAQQHYGSGTLSEMPPDQAGSDTYDYDPRDPVPTLWSRTLITEPSDRRKLEHRSDILYYRTPPLAEDIEVVGHPEVVLHAASSAPDTDFFAHLVDEDPGGIALEVCYSMMRVRHRNGLDREELLTAGEAVELRIKLGPTACRFVKGHRIRLEITSSNFPNHDRNHNTGGDDLAETTLVTAHQTVHHSPEHPSRLELPVDPKTHD